VHFTVSTGGAASPPFNAVACAVTSLTARDSAQTSGTLAANGAVLIQNQTIIQSNVVAGGDLTVRDSARVTLAADYGGTLSLLGSGVIQGGATHVTPAPTPCTCSYDLSAQLAAAAAQNDNALITGNPQLAQYLVNGGLELTDATATLPAGTYSLTHVHLRGTARLLVAVGGTARLFLTGSFITEGTSFAGGSSSQSGALIVVSSVSGIGVDFHNTSGATARIYAPNADFNLENGSQLTGAAVGHSIMIRDQHRLGSDGVGDGGLPLVCP